MTGDQNKRIAEGLEELGFDKHWAVDLPSFVTHERYEQSLQGLGCTADQSLSASAAPASSASL